MQNVTCKSLDTGKIMKCVMETRTIVFSGVERQIRTLEPIDFRGDYRELSKDDYFRVQVTKKNGSRCLFDVKLECLSGLGNSVYRMVEI